MSTTDLVKKILKEMLKLESESEIQEQTYLAMLNPKDINLKDIEADKDLATVFNELLNGRGTPFIYNKTKEHHGVYDKISSGVTKTPKSDTLLKIAIVLKCSDKDLLRLFKAAKSSITTTREKIIRACIRSEEYDMLNVDIVLNYYHEKSLFALD